METILHKGRKIERSDFIYNCEEDYYECPLIVQCLPGSSKTKLKRIYRDGREILVENMNDKLQTDEAQSRLKLRAASVEPVPLRRN